jgi:hypothetical protein
LTRATTSSATRRLQPAVTASTLRATTTAWVRSTRTSAR